MALHYTKEIDDYLNRGFTIDGKIFVPIGKSPLEHNLNYANTHALHVVTEYLQRNNLRVYAPAQSRDKESTKLVGVSTHRDNEHSRQNLIGELIQLHKGGLPLYIPEREDPLEFLIAHQELTLTGMPSYVTEHSDKPIDQQVYDSLVLLKPRRVAASRIARMF